MNKKIGLYFNKKRIAFISVLTVVLIAVLSTFVIYTINTVNKKVTKSCFDELAITSKQLSASLYSSIKSDHTTLSAIATIIENHDALSNEDLCKLLNSYNFDASYISYLEVLKPDGTMLDANGQVRDVSSSFDFSKEAEKGNYVSGIRHSTRDPNVKILRHAVPIKKGNKTTCILFGVIKLSNLAARYKTDLYDGHAYVYIVDGDNGDFILDTWHKSLGNIVDLGKRKELPGYSLENAIKNMHSGLSGEIGFISKTTGNALYARHEPIGINNWNVMITVEKKYALADRNTVSNSLYLMAIVIGIALLLYIACVAVCLLGAYKQVKTLGTEDQSTGLLNRNIYDMYLFDCQKKVFDSISCVYIDVNGLHSINNDRGHNEGDRILQLLATMLKQEFDFATLFRIGGDEFIAFSEKYSLNECSDKTLRISNALEKIGYSISSGILQYKNEMGLDRIIRDTDELMLKNKRLYHTEHDIQRRY